MTKTIDEMIDDSVSPEFVRAYLECALWSSTIDDEDGNLGTPYDSIYAIDDFSNETVAHAIVDCNNFIQANREDLDEVSDTYHVDYSQHGHDFWLTRNGHGAGFWDRGYGEVGDRLSKASKVYGSTYLYINDHNQICVD